MKKNQFWWCAVLVAAVLVSSGVTLARTGAPVGLWEFSDSSNLIKPTIGTNLTARGVNLSAVAGAYPGDHAVRIGVSSDYAVTNTIGANGGGVNTNEWTLLYDVKVPRIVAWNSILRTTTGDGDIWIRSNGEIGNSELFTPGYGTGILANTWQRVIMRVKNGEYFDIWIDGVRVLNGTAQPLDGLCSLKPTFWIFSDEDKEEENSDVSNVALWNYPLSEADIVDLGNVNTAIVPFAIVESLGITKVVEGTLDDTYTLELLPDPNEGLPVVQRWPSSEVTVNLYPDVHVAVSPLTVVFPAWTGDPNDYKATITVAAIDDTVDEGSRLALITHSAVCADPKWGACPIADVTVSVVDNDGPPSVVFSKDHLWVGEGDDPNDSYAVNLNCPPAAGKTVTVQINAGDQCAAAPSSVVFSAANWFDSQVVVISGIDDSIIEGTHFSTIQHAIVTTDPGYAALSLPALNVAIGDNDAQGPAGIASVPAAWYNENSAVNRTTASLAADGEVVDLWEDQSGNRRYANSAMAQGVGYPVFDGETQSLSFNGNQAIKAVFTTLPQPTTIFVVTRQDTISRYVFDGSAAGRQILSSTVTKRWQIGAGTFTQSSSFQLGVPVIHAITYNGTNSVHRINGRIVTYTGVGTQGLGGLNIGSYYGSTSGFGLDGTISELIVYTQAMAVDDIKKVEEYLAAKWTDRFNVFESDYSTTVSSTASQDTYQVYLYGTPTQNVDVTVTPLGGHASDIDLGNGPGAPITIRFTPDSSAPLTIKVRASQVPIEGGIRQVALSHAISSDDVNYNGAQLRDVVVSVIGSDPYCGQPNSTYLPSDLNKDCYTNIFDLAVLATNWLLCTDPADPTNCVIP